MPVHRVHLLVGLLLLLNLQDTHAVTDGETFGDWRARCATPEHDATPDNCHVFQDLLHKDSGKRMLHIAVGRLPGRQPLAVIVTLPLGIALPHGVTIQVDENSPVRVPVQMCFANGCQAAFELKPRWREELTAGKTAEVVFYNINNHAISIPVSLKGVTAAIRALRSGE